MNASVKPKPPQGKLLDLLKPYRGLVAGLIALTIGASALNLLVPLLISRAVDAFTQRGVLPPELVRDFLLAGFVIFLLTYAQSQIQTLAAEKVARELREKLAAKISVQSYAQVESIGAAKLLTNLTSDVDSVKMFIAQAVSTIVSSVFLIVGSSILMLTINWRLALCVISIVPLIGLTFRFVLIRVRKLFREAQQAVDSLNRVINESILGAAMIRILNTQHSEYDKFVDANAKARDIGMGILRLFSALIPVITLAWNLAVVVILGLGGNFVIDGKMTLGDFTAFNSYLMVLVFPIMLIGLMSNVIAMAGASYGRIEGILNAPEAEKGTRLSITLRGEVAMDDVSLEYGDKKVLKNVSFTARPGTKTAILGPTAAGKTQILQLLIGLSAPTSGKILYDGTAIEDFDAEALHRQVGLVFQDSALFNLSLRENIGFSKVATDADLQKAIATAEIDGFIESLPQKLDSLVSERGTTLSGGQKQRVMLARALALEPKVLLLDDFTARVDTRTEQSILENLERNYPGITLISVTQKILSVEHYDQILLLMEGEVLGIGTHESLMATCPEYVQVYNSQRSTSHYELQI